MLDMDARGPRKTKGTKRKSALPPPANHKCAHLTYVEDMFAAYQPWVIKTYGDLAKTKTITLKKYARILRTLRGDEVANSDNSKFRFWVKTKEFHIGQPDGYEPKPADSIVGRYSVCDVDNNVVAINKLQGSAKDPSLYVPHPPFKESNGSPAHRKVAVVENFFDIIYNVHVELEGRPGKHAGQKRTYRTITETYAFLPREAVTRFLLGCTECQKHPARSPSPLLPTPSPSPTPDNANVASTNNNNTDVTHCCNNEAIKRTKTIHKRDDVDDDEKTKKTQSKPSNNSDKKLTIDKLKVTIKLGDDSDTVNHPLDVCNSLSSPKLKPKTKTSKTKRLQLWRPQENVIERESDKKGEQGIDYSMPITTTYLKYMRSLGYEDEDALHFHEKKVSIALDNFLHDFIDHYFT